MREEGADSDPDLAISSKFGRGVAILAELTESRTRTTISESVKERATGKGASIYDVRTEGGRGYLQKQT